MKYLPLLVMIALTVIPRIAYPDTEEVSMKFMMKWSINQEPTDEMMSLVPAEIARGEELKQAGIVVASYVGAGQSVGWMVMQGGSRDVIDAAVASLPLFSYLDFEITPLE